MLCVNVQAAFQFNFVFVTIKIGFHLFVTRDETMSLNENHVTIYREAKCKDKLFSKYIIYRLRKGQGNNR